MTPRILIIDNHDSFVYNLVQLVREAEESCLFDVVPASLLCEEMEDMYDALIISPGPGLPTDQPKMMQMLSAFAESKKPILGVCLGCQAIALHYGYKLQQLNSPLHGHTSELIHGAEGILRGLPSKTSIGRYHSWVVDITSGGSTLREEGFTVDRDGKQTMVIRHESLPIWGLQFHPESIMTAYGSLYINNWLRLIKQ